MPTRNVVLTDHDADVIDRLVKSGRYQNASQVLGEGLRLVERREVAEAAKLEALQKAARLGFADLEEGRFTDIADDELEDAIAALGREAEARVRKVHP
ncbi:type II toxin-antitoxin system ParD family antitoxin [Rhizobiales bacterium RZME27]|jgi:antitoxin ParD1/3/4|uniref:Type II toxin-antitoxin system ParD family antitoxin n=1 Tax=Endobacterium cereale TaxID=2663029 RepID=A0A6A8A1D0_9HYPH|nr:type II toxin-antitoxin system ParD family antitoxin [Endobacterium cereale]MEB2844805.1 type II toxin-antitoxin system ParD family antitoxin [Endobacterium cereale]MQY44722.1 type II toxin-antitoxin system ParD family antitoxin [Endobacterium cereale]